MMHEILTAKVPDQAVILWWLGQAGYIMKTASSEVIVVDAYLSNLLGEERPGKGFDRLFPAPILAEEIQADFFMCTHDHLDHLDPVTVEKLNFNNIGRFVGSASCCRIFKELGIPESKIVRIGAGDQLALGDIALEGVPSSLSGQNNSESIGYLIRTADGVTIYHTGDTGFFPSLIRLKNAAIDVLLTCINGRWGNLNPDEAVSLVAILEPKLTIPNHYDMFPCNLADPDQFLKKLFLTVPQAKATKLKIMEAYTYSKNSIA